ncbi:extracellular matrix protein precursor [Metarhizium brunneum]
MKYALVISALAALATAAEKPKFLNSNFQIIEGQSFDLKFDGCEGGCTITLQDGPNTNLKDYKVISTSATGGSLAWVPEGVVSGTYAFKITNNANKEYNYSQQFSFLGTGATVSASAASTTGSSTDSATATASSTEASSTVSITASSTESSTQSITASTTISTVTSSATAASGSSTTSAPSSATSHSSTSTRSTTAATTTVPNAGVRATPMAFVAGAVAALAYLG